MKFGPRSLLYYLTRDDSPVTASLLKQPWCPPPPCCPPKKRCPKGSWIDSCPGIDRLRHRC